MLLVFLFLFELRAMDTHKFRGKKNPTRAIIYTLDIKLYNLIATLVNRRLLYAVQFGSPDVVNPKKSRMSLTAFYTQHTHAQQWPNWLLNLIFSKNKHKEDDNDI
jgi:hypothetical protein